MTTTDHDSTQTTKTDTVELEQLVLEDAKLAETADAIAERRAQIRARLAKVLDAGTHDLAGHKVVVTQPGRLDAKALERDFPVAQHPEMYEAKLSTSAVRKQLAPAVLEEKYTTHGAKQVSIR